MRYGARTDATAGNIKVAAEDLSLMILPLRPRPPSLDRLRSARASRPWLVVG